MTRIAEGASERAADVVEGVVESAVAQVEGALESAEARAEAAEELNETILESARRDALHDEIEEVQEELEAWQLQVNQRLDALQTQNALLEQRLQTTQDQMTELANRSTVTTVSIPAPSADPEAGPIAETLTVTTETVTPESAAEATQVAPVAREKARRWI